jgi:ADP-heptose:LPS heptosyltransferase
MALFISIVMGLEKSSIRNIGIYRALHLGDMLCIIPAVRAIRNAFPNAAIYLIGLSWQQAFAKRFHLYFDHFIEFPGWPGLPEQHTDTKKIPSFLSAMQALQLDLLFQMQGNGEITNTMCALWGAKTLTGLRRENQYCPDEKLFPVSEDDDHEILRFLKLTNALGLPSHGVHLEFPFSEEEILHFQAVSDRLNLSAGKYICMHVGARDPRRRWPLENFAAVADRLAETGYQVVLTGSKEEAGLLQHVSQQMNFPSINTIGILDDLSLADLALIIQHAVLLLSNDTGVSHIAAALSVPSVIIFSPFSNPARWAPLNRSLHHIITSDQANDIDYVMDSTFTQLQFEQRPSTDLLH